MACDEALITTTSVAVLRLFLWKGPWVSAGYFTDRGEATKARPDLPFCRRWTGGGVVAHDGDFTYSLIVPRRVSLGAIKPDKSYLLIHSALALALRARGVVAGLFSEKSPAAAECFAGAVQHDLVLGGTKIAGGAQRRTSHGLLHQGSVQCKTGLGRDFGIAFARALAVCVGEWTPPAGFEKSVEKLAMDKYASKEFLLGPRAAKDFTAGARA